jgi:hypothetical protein
MVWVRRLDATGRHIDTGSGFVIGKDRVATAFQLIDSAAGLEVEFAGGRVIKTDQIWNTNRLQDWAIIRADTQDVPPLSRDDSKMSYIGERLAVFNVEGGRVRAITGVDITGRDQEALFGERIQISPPTSAASVGGPLLGPLGKVAGILGGGMLPGSRVNPDGFASAIPALSGLVRVRATPVALIPDTVPASPVSLQSLADAGVFSTPIAPFASFIYGAMTTVLPKSPTVAASRDLNEFSKKDPAIWVYSQWQKKDKDGKGTIGAKVYDIQNRLIATMPPKKTTLYLDPSRSSFSFEPAKLPQGIYRVDILWQDQVVWRSFFRIVD